MIMFTVKKGTENLTVTIEEAVWCYDPEDIGDDEKDYGATCAGITVSDQDGNVILDEPTPQTYSVVLKDSEFAEHNGLADENARDLAQGITNFYRPMVCKMLGI